MIRRLLDCCRNIPREYALLGVLAFGVYLPGFWWGAPHATGPLRVQSWGVDDGTPLQPLADVHNIIQPKPDRNFGYPLMHSFATTAAYAPYLGYLYATGQFRPATGYPFGLKDPVAALRTLSRIAHLMSVLLGVGVVLCAYDAARALWNQRAGAIAALFVLSMYPMFYYSRAGNPDVMMMFFFAASIAALARILQHGLAWRRALALGACAGFAAATKEQVAAAYLALPLILLGNEWLTERRLFRAQFWKLAIAAGFACFIAFGLGSGLFADPAFYLVHLEFGRERMAAVGAGQVSFVKYYPWTAEGNWQLTLYLLNFVVGNITWFGVIAALGGIVLAARRQPKVLLLALAAVTYILILFVSTRSGMLRYLMPPSFVLLVIAAGFIESGLGARGAFRYGAATMGILIFGLGALRGADLTHAMVTDSRFAAGAWIDSNVRAGQTIEYFGPDSPLPPMPAEVQQFRTTTFKGAVYRARRDEEAAAEVRQGWAERRPEFILLLPDHSSQPGEPYNVTLPPSVYDDLLQGQLGYRLVALFETPALLPWVQRPALDYPSVNPPVRIFARDDLARELAQKGSAQ